MVTIGTPKSATATKVLLCGSGELGKEFVIELQRYGVEVIALDKYADAPAMQVAHRSYVVSMLDGDALREIVEKEKPDYIVPEVEAIGNTDVDGTRKRRIPCHPDCTCHLVDHEPRRHPPSGCRGIGPADLSLSLCRDGRRVYRGCQSDRDALCRQADHEFERTRTECHPQRGRYRPLLALCTGRRTCRRGK